MAAQLYYYSPDRQDELMWARHKIKHLKEVVNDTNAQVEELQEENRYLKVKQRQLKDALKKEANIRVKRDGFYQEQLHQLQDAMEDQEWNIGSYEAENRDLKRKIHRLRKQWEAKKLEISQLHGELAHAEELSNSLYAELADVKAECRQLRYALEYQGDLCHDQHRKNEKLREELDEARDFNENLKSELEHMSVGIHGWRCALEQTEAAKEQLEELLAVEHTTRENQEEQIATLKQENGQLKEECQLICSASVSKEQSMLAEVKELKNVNIGLRKQLKQIISKERRETMQKLQMEQRMSKLEKADKSKAKRRRRKAGKVDTASKLAEGTGQPRCDAEAAASESATLEVEDEELTYSQPSKPCGVNIDINDATCPVEGEVECKDTEDAKSSQRMAQEVVVKLTPVFVEQTAHDSEDVPFSSSDTLPPSQQAEIVVQATEESAGRSPSTNQKKDFPCGIPADHAVPLTSKRRHSWHKPTIADKRRSALIYRVNSNIANYKQRPAILTNCREIRDKNRLIAKLKEQVQFLSELHEKGEKGYMKVSVEFQQICEQFIPRDSEIHQLVISQLPQIATGQDCEYWLKVLQAVLGLSTAACSCRNWHCMFQHWLSGRGSGPPIWKTLFDKLENSDIKELQRIARFLKARLHEFMPWSRLEEDGRCIACGQLLPRSIQEEEDKIFISKEESTNPGD